MEPENKITPIKVWLAAKAVDFYPWLYREVTRQDSYILQRRSSNRKRVMETGKKILVVWRSAPHAQEEIRNVATHARKNLFQGARRCSWTSTRWARRLPKSKAGLITWKGVVNREDIRTEGFFRDFLELDSHIPDSITYSPIKIAECMSPLGVRDFVYLPEHGKFPRIDVYRDHACRFEWYEHHLSGGRLSNEHHISLGEEIRVACHCWRTLCVPS